MGGIEVLPFGMLIFVVGTLLVANAWAVVDAKLAVDAAAREAARTFVEGDGRPAGDAAARRRRREAIAGHGRDPGRLVLELRAPAGLRPLRRSSTVGATYPVPAVPLPWIGGVGDGISGRRPPRRAGRPVPRRPRRGGRSAEARR